MHSFSALMQSANDSTSGKALWKCSMALKMTKSSTSDISSSPALAQSVAHPRKVLKQTGTSAIFPPKMAVFTQDTRGGPHFWAHFAVSPPTQVAKSTKHLNFCNPVDADMHSFSALMQSANDSTSGKVLWKRSMTLMMIESSTLEISSSPAFAQSVAHPRKVLKQAGTSAIFPPKMAVFTHDTRGGPHFWAHFAVSPPTQVAISIRHLTFCTPVDAFMHSFSALMQSANDSTSGKALWKCSMALKMTKSSTSDISSSPALAQSVAHPRKVLKQTGTSAIFPPKMAVFTQDTRGGPHFWAHFAVSPPTQVAKSTKHLNFCNPVDADMHSFSALMQSANDSTSGKVLWK